LRTPVDAKRLIFVASLAADLRAQRGAWTRRQLPDFLCTAAVVREATPLSKECDMKLEKRTILITGGTSGIGLELAKRLQQRGNMVIVTGRDQEKLDAVKSALAGVHVFKSDVSDPAAIVALHDAVLTQFPALAC
jgi:FlaA1/EpsC-like NDP-sugar epimerase